MPLTTHQPLPDTLGVLGFADTVVDVTGFGPNDLYVERCWTPVVGPTTFLLWRALLREIPDVGTDPVAVDSTELLVGLGVSESLAKHSPGPRAVTRLVMFDFAYRAGRGGAVLAVRRHIGPLPAHFLGRLPYGAARSHYDTVNGLGEGR